MGYHLLIVPVVVAHYLFVICAVFGGFAVMKWPRMAWIHIPLFIWAGFIVLLPWPCPLTVLENHLRSSAGLPTYGEGFMAHYIHAEIRAVGFGWLIPYLGYFVLLLNGIIYLTILLRRRRVILPNGR